MKLRKVSILSPIFVASLAFSNLIGCDEKQSSDKQDHSQHAASAGHDHGSHDQDKPGHGKGDPGHAPLDTVKSANGVFLASIVWSENLTADSLENSATITFWEPEYHMHPASLSKFSLYMPAMGHGSLNEELLEISATNDPAIWTVSKIYFSMGGDSNDWVVDIEAEMDGVVDTVRIAIPYSVE